MKKQKHLLIIAIIMIIALLSSCNQTETPAPSHVHSWSEWTTTLEATCTKEGKQERSCSCGNKETKSVATVAHTEVIIEAVAATCEKEGTTEGKLCSVCQIAIVKQDVIPMVEHNFVDRFCSFCGCLGESEGLRYSLSSDGTYYSVSKGTCTDANIVIPSSYNGLPIANIGDSAFDNYTSLTSITIPDSVTSIGNYAFLGCTSLTSITIPDSVTSIGDRAFRACVSLTSVTIPNSVTSIGDYTFEVCTSLTNVTVGNSIKSIGDSVFSGCVSLTSVTIPDSVTRIGDSTFKNCTSLKDVYYTGTEAEWKAIRIGNDNKALTNATIHYNSSN